MIGEHEIVFRSMGTRVRLIVGARTSLRAAPAGIAAAEARDFIEDFARRLSRFRADSELSALNHDPRPVVPASPLLITAIAAGLWAAELTGGLADPTLTDAIERAGYLCSRDGAVPAPLADALLAAGPRRPARPDPRARWREFAVDWETRTVRRPPGLRFDTGGSGKGLAADLVAERLEGHERFAVDCGGDIRIGGPGAALRPIEVQVRDPLGGGSAHRMLVSAGGVATSGIDTRIWRSGGRFAHHILDPATGEPAWTGLISATAIAATALEAESLAKAALLGGPHGGRTLLAPRGGVLVHDSGEVEVLGSAAGHVGPRVTLPAPEGTSPRDPATEPSAALVPAGDAA